MLANSDRRTWPQLTIGRVRFHDGLFETSDPELQRLVEKAHGFGVHIQEITTVPAISKADSNDPTNGM
jgi:hypothetical protein